MHDKMRTCLSSLERGKGVRLIFLPEMVSDFVWSFVKVTRGKREEVCKTDATASTTAGTADYNYAYHPRSTARGRSRTQVAHDNAIEQERVVSLRVIPNERSVAAVENKLAQSIRINAD